MMMGSGVLHATASLHSKTMLCFYHKFIAKDNMSIMVCISVRLWKYGRILPLSTGVPSGGVLRIRTIHEFNGLQRINVGAIKSCMFLLIHHLKPDSFNALYSASKHASKTAKNISEAMFEWLWSIEQLTSPFYTLRGKSLGFSMTSSFHHLTSWWGSSHFARVVQSAAFLPKDTPVHGHKLQNIPPFCHSSSRFWRGNILDASLTQ